MVFNNTIISGRSRRDQFGGSFASIKFVNKHTFKHRHVPRLFCRSKAVLSFQDRLSSAGDSLRPVFALQNILMNL